MQVQEEGRVGGSWAGTKTGSREERQSGSIPSSAWRTMWTGAPSSWRAVADWGGRARVPRSGSACRFQSASASAGLSPAVRPGDAGGGAPTLPEGHGPVQGVEWGAAR